MGEQGKKIINDPCRDAINRVSTFDSALSNQQTINKNEKEITLYTSSFILY